MDFLTQNSELFFAVCLGIGLSAACGFRVFVPLLGLSSASLAGYLTLSPGLEWIGSWPAFGCFLSATILEVAAYYIPWVDNALDSIATPAAIAAGTVATASVITDVPPLVQWSVALIAGGGTAGTIQTATVMIRGTSTATTAGFGNFIVATMELIASVCTTIMALLLPVFCAGLVLLAAAVALLRFRKPRAVASAKPA